MQPSLYQATFTGILALAGVFPAGAAIDIDGTRSVGETDYTALHVQAHTSAWGPANTLANIHSAQTGKLLNLFIGGRAAGNAVLLFIDSKAGGISSITRSTIASGGLETDLNNLAPESGTGLTFENDFQPDFAIRVYGTGVEAYGSLFDLEKRIRSDMGRIDLTAASHGPVSGVRAAWSDSSATSSGYADAINGVEIALNMALLGVPEGAQTVKVMAMLVNSDSTYGSNQTLGSLATPSEMGGGVTTYDLQSEADTQTLPIAVNRPALVSADDEDGDGITNGSDPFPLDQTRSITFHVNMNVEAAKGDFDPPSTVEAQFFSGSQQALSKLTLTDPDGDQVYSGTLEDVKGWAGDSFGTYKFVTNDPQNTNSGYEFGFDRTFNLAAADDWQELNAVYFSNETTLPYAAWSAENAGGQSLNSDFDGDGVENGVEYFMGATGAGFTANPESVDGLVTWPRSPIATGLSYKIWTSEDLTSWTDATAGVDASDPALLQYTLPADSPKRFVRLEVSLP
jgi:hypothetical protein